MRNKCDVNAMRRDPLLRRIPGDRIEIYTRERFASPENCARLIALIDRNLRPSTIADGNGDAAFRTSETCDLDMSNPLVARLDHAFSAFSGIDRRFGEALQGQRYQIGQEFKPHTDYFDPGGADYARYCGVAGQRTWTFMLYLNAVQAGGGTRFGAIDTVFRPETGKLLCWNNRRDDGRCNPQTLHHGMKVEKGVKYVITKWYREKSWA